MNPRKCHHFRFVWSSKKIVGAAMVAYTVTATTTRAKKCIFAISSACVVMQSVLAFSSRHLLLPNPRFMRPVTRPLTTKVTKPTWAMQAQPQDKNTASSKLGAYSWAAFDLHAFVSVEKNFLTCHFPCHQAPWLPGPSWPPRATSSLCRTTWIRRLPYVRLARSEKH